jgi:hypothetical protein
MSSKIGRQARRESLQTERFISNKKGISLVVHGTTKLKKVVQNIEGKRIEHYIMHKRSKFCFCKKPNPYMMVAPSLFKKPKTLKECRDCHKPIRKKND